MAPNNFIQADPASRVGLILVLGRMKPSIVKSLLISLLSAGWLLPLTWSARFFLDYLNFVYLPEVKGQAPLASAPLDNMAMLAFQIACGWLFLVIGVWSFVAYRAIKRGAA